MAQITVHHLENSRSQRVLWLLEELDLEYGLVEYKRHPKTSRAPVELTAIHPLGKSPVVVLEDGTVLAESGAIVDELLDRYGDGRLRPEPGTEAYRRYRFWLHYAEGSLMPPLLVKLISSRIQTAPLPFFVRPIAKGIAGKVDNAFTDPEIDKHLQFIESELSEHKWLTGDELTGADIQMSYPLLAGSARRTRLPKISAYLEQIAARPAYERALERGGPVHIPG